MGYDRKKWTPWKCSISQIVRNSVAVHSPYFLRAEFSRNRDNLLMNVDNKTNDWKGWHIFHNIQWKISRDIYIRFVAFRRKKASFSRVRVAIYAPSSPLRGSSFISPGSFQNGIQHPAYPFKISFSFPSLTYSPISFLSFPPQPTNYSSRLGRWARFSPKPFPPPPILPSSYLSTLCHPWLKPAISLSSRTKLKHNRLPMCLWSTRERFLYNGWGKQSQSLSTSAHNSSHPTACGKLDNETKIII
jgi:hypothetical protein